MLPATKRSLPSSWKAVFVMVDVGPPITTSVEEPFAPKRSRLEVGCTRKKNGEPSVTPPRATLAVEVTGERMFVSEL